MSQHNDKLVRSLRYAWSASPESLRAMVRPLVRRLDPKRVRADIRESGVVPTDITVANRWVENRFTIIANDQKRHFFFLRGCYKSGTNWVANLLNLHPHACIRGEFHFEVLQNAVERLTDTSWFLGSRPRLREVTIEASEAMVRRMIFAATRNKPAAIWLGDRTPSPLRSTIRGAPQIIITRDVRDVLVSWSFHHLRVNDEASILPFFREKWSESRAAFVEDPDDFDPLGGLLGHEGWLRFHTKQWVMISRKSREALPKLKEEGVPVLVLRYEQLHADLPGEINRLYAFLHLDPALAKAPSVKTKTIPGFVTENRRSFYRKGEVGEWRGILNDRMCKIIKEEAGKEMVAAGYEENLNW